MSPFRWILSRETTVNFHSYTGYEVTRETPIPSSERNEALLQNLCDSVPILMRSRPRSNSDSVVSQKGPMVVDEENNDDDHDDSTSKA